MSARPLCTSVKVKGVTSLQTFNAAAMACLTSAFTNCQGNLTILQQRAEEQRVVVVDKLKGHKLWSRPVSKREERFIGQGCPLISVPQLLWFLSDFSCLLISWTAEANLCFLSPLASCHPHFPSTPIWIFVEFLCSLYSLVQLWFTTIVPAAVFQ